MTRETTEIRSPEKWRRALDVFEQAASLDPTGREAFLDSSCGSDMPLRQTVKEMIEASRQAETESFMESPVVSYSPPGAGDAALLGERVGAYRLTRFISGGGMGLVYEAERADGRFRKRVAIKLMRDPLNELELRYFKREAQSLADLEHPNIARLIDSGELPDGRPYLVMEYVDGRNLQKLIQTEGAMPPGKVVAIIRQAGAGLDAAHRKGIIHRDIKPANIVVAKEGGELLVKVLDFGVALRTQTLSAGAALHQQAIGTLPYMSPEQCKGAGRDGLTPASDIYSLGLVAYEMLTGERAVKGKSPTEIIAEHLAGRPQPPSQLRPDVTTAIDQVVMRALAKEPERRYQSTLDFAAAFEASLRKAGWRNYVKPIVAVAAAVVVVAATYLLWPRGQGISQPVVSSSPASAARPRNLKLLLKVENTRGAPLPDSSFALFKEGITAEPEKITAENALILRTDREGRAETGQASVKPGTYLMKAVRIGYKSIVANVTLSEDRGRPGTATLVVTLGPE